MRRSLPTAHRLPRRLWQRAGAGAVLALFLLLTVPSGIPTSLSGASQSLLAPPAPSLRALEAPVAVGAPAQLGNYHDPVLLPTDTTVHATLTLAPRDPSALASYAGSPGAPKLTSSEVAQAFGPSPASVSNLRAYLAENGLTVRAPANGWVWEVSGPASSFSRAFDTPLVQYDSGNPSAPAAIAYASVPKLPADLPVVALSSPDALGAAQPLVVPASPPPATALSGSSSAPSGAPKITTSACPNGSLTPASVQRAYNITPVLSSGDLGQGERIGIVDAYDTQEKPWRIQHDLSLFSSCYGLPQQNATIAWPVPGPSGLNNSTSSGWGLEIALDLEWAHATAPDAALTMVLSPNNAYGLYYGVAWLVATQAVDVISLSWGEPETGVFNFGPCNYECNASTDGTFATLEPVLESAAAEGMNVFVASGDCGANGGTLQNTAWYPASDPHAIGVGGTVLNLSSSGAYQNETAWDGTSSFCLNGGGSGGGFSVLPRPGWQSGPGFSRYANTTRGVPDVSIVSAVPLGIFYQGNAQYVEGTSDGAPQWAGMDALLKEGSNGSAPGRGFLSPALYQVLRSPSYATDFHDVTTGWNGYTTGVGWDPVTGIGTPNFSHLFQDLTGGSFRSFSPPAPGSMLLSAEPLAGVAPLPVQFRAGALPSAVPSTSYTFYYGDTGAPYQEANASFGTTNSSTYLYPADAAVNFTTPGNGTYAAFATALDTADNVTMSVPVAINVGNAGPLEVSANATAVPAGGLTRIRATAAGGTGPYRFSYFFGDGTYENTWAEDGPSIDHVYLRNGSYLLGVVANDSSDPMRGGSTTLCVVVGPGPATCPMVPRTLVDDLVPSSNLLVGGATTMVRLTATFNGLPVPGAQVQLSPLQGSFSARSGTTGASGSFYVNYTAPVVNHTVVFGIFANLSATGYATGMGEALLRVDPTTGPSITPWVRFGRTPAYGGSSEAIVVGGLKAYRGYPASNASLSIDFSGGASGSLTGSLDGSGIYATTWTVPSVTSPTEAALTVTLGLPGFTSASFRFLLPILPSPTPDAAVAALTLGTGSIVSMGTVPLSVNVHGSTSGSGLPVKAANVTLSSQPYGVLSHWASPGAGLVQGLFSTLITPTATGDILVVNVSGGGGSSSGWSNGSAATVLEVHGGYGPLSLKLVTDPVVFRPGEHGNLTVQASSRYFGTPLTRVFMLVSPDQGNPSQKQGNSVFGWTNAYGNLSFVYTAPRTNTTVVVNVQAVGFVYAFTQDNFSIPVHVINVTTLPWTANFTGQAVLLVGVVTLASALTAVLLVERRRRHPPVERLSHAPPASSPSAEHDRAAGAGTGTGTVTAPAPPDVGPHG